MMCKNRTEEGQGREYTEEDREYVPPKPQIPPPSSRRRTRGSSKLRASSVPINVPRRRKKRILPVINEEDSSTVEGELGKELQNINTRNLQKGLEEFEGSLPKGVLPRSVLEW